VAKGTILVCLPRSAGNPGGFDDNRYAPCASCGEKVQYRPHAPEPSEKVCVSCVAALLPRDRPVEVCPTAETLEDLRRWRATRG
jgi:hypothetical protein